MNYGDQSFQNKLHKRRIRFGAEYKVSADVANFYPGFYTHSVPWALVGHQVAKANRQSSLWHNDIDMRLRDCNRGETMGLHVGPGPSALAADVVLAAVDERLRDRYSYIRFVDDYEFYAKNRPQAEQFILDLAQELSRFNLKLNSGKTKIEALPLPDSPGWMRTLIPHVPKSTQFSRLEPYLEEAIELAKDSPDGSVLKFAAKAILDAKDIRTRTDEILPCLFTISFHNPGLLPEISDLFRTGNADGTSYTDELNELLQRHARFKRSDGMSWILHIMREEEVKIDDDSVADVLATDDCISILLLYKLGQMNASMAAIEYAKQQLATNSHEYDIDQKWILYYELFLASEIENPYDTTERQKAARTSFDILKEDMVSFIT
jgi:hypothetical protein